MEGEKKVRNSSSASGPAFSIANYSCPGGRPKFHLFTLTWRASENAEAGNKCVPGTRSITASISGGRGGVEGKK